MSDTVEGERYDQPVVFSQGAMISTSREKLAEMYPMSAIEAKRVTPEVRAPVIDPPPPPPKNESPILGQLTKGQRKLCARWSSVFGAVPVAELRAILSNDLGYNSEEIRQEIAERAIVLWVNKNELRMKRDLRNHSAVT